MTHGDALEAPQRTQTVFPTRSPPAHKKARSVPQKAAAGLFAYDLNGRSRHRRADRIERRGRESNP